MDARERIYMLHKNGVVGEKSTDLSLKSIEWLSARGIDMDCEQAQMFITHFVMALERMFRGEKVELLSDGIIDEIRTSAGYGLAQEFLNFVERENKINLPESEKGYIFLHLCSLVGKEV